MKNNNGSDKSLESWIWDAACSIRGAKDAPKYKDYKKPTSAMISVRGTAVAVFLNPHFNSGEFATIESQAGLQRCKQDARDAAA